MPVADTTRSAFEGWSDLFHHPPLCEVPRHFAATPQASYLMEYLVAALRVARVSAALASVAATMALPLLFRAGIVYREISDLKRSEQSYVTLLTEREVGHIDSIEITMAVCNAHHNLVMVYPDFVPS